MIYYIRSNEKGNRNRMSHKKKKIIKVMVLVVFCILFFMSPFYQVVKSYTVMAVYSTYHKINTPIYKEGIRIHIPGGYATLKKDYYPFVMTYDTTQEYSDYIGEPVDLVVLYNFGAMEWFKGSSLMYEKNSPYYSGFYGAYVARYEDEAKQYGMNSDGDINVDEVMKVTNFDLKHLVLNSMGCQQPELTYNIEAQDHAIFKMIDGKKFRVIDATLTMSGMWHSYKTDYMAYIQYGRPPKGEALEQSFETIQGFGRIYLFFDTEQNTSYFFYIIAPTKETIEETEKNFILKSKITR